MSEQAPNHQYEVQWESAGTHRSEIVHGDDYLADHSNQTLSIYYYDGNGEKPSHFELVGMPFVIKEIGE